MRSLGGWSDKTVQDENTDGDRGHPIAGTDHGQDEVDDVKCVLHNVDAKEERRRQLAPGAHDDANDVEDQAEQDNGHDHARHGQHGVVAEVRVVLVVQAADVVPEHPQAGNYEGVQGDLDEHDDDADDPEWNQHALEEGRRVADDVRAGHVSLFGVDILGVAWTSSKVRFGGVGVGSSRRDE